MVHTQWSSTDSSGHLYRSIRQRSPHRKLRRRGNPYLVFLATLGLLTAGIAPASASRNGLNQTSNSFTVGYTYDSNGTTYVCSGTLISPTVVMTAAHCTVDKSGKVGSDFIISYPGEALDAPIDPSNPHPVPSRFVLYPGFKPSGNNEVNDIGFIILNKPMPNKTFIPLATAADIAQFNVSTQLQGYGYGYVFETNESYSSLPKKYELTWENHALDEPANNMIRIASKKATACVGDSGGPITAEINGTEKVFAVLSGILNTGGGKCGGQDPDGYFNIHAVIVHPYLNMISGYLAEEQAAMKAKATPSNSPKPAPAATSSATSSSKPTTKKVTITCYSGKTIKKVSGVSPKCPPGFKKL